MSCSLGPGKCSMMPLLLMSFPNMCSLGSSNPSQSCWPKKHDKKDSVQMLNHKLEEGGYLCSPSPEMAFRETPPQKHQREPHQTFLQHLPCVRPFARRLALNPHPNSTNRVCYHHCKRKDTETQKGWKTETCHPPKPCFFHDIMGLPFICRCHHPDAFKTFGRWPV